MSSVSNKDIALSVVHFLKKSVSTNEIPEDYAESMDVAIDCIADAFEVNKDEDTQLVDSKFGGKSLTEIISFFLSSKTETKEEKEEVDSETKERADQLKVEGNRAMAARNFEEAISKYTDAIELDPSNVVYLSNRAAAYSSSSQHEKAVEDAEKAIELNPNFSKAYSRLGLAKYALGDAKDSMEAYKRGLDIEGDKKSDAMTKGYETAKRRVEEELEKSIPKSEVVETNSAEGEQSSRSASGESGSTNGLPDLSNLFGSGGMSSLTEMMNNPQVMQAAQELMSNPSALQGLMNNPSIRQMTQNMGLGGQNGSGPDLSELMNNPMLRNMANQFMGGRGNNNNDDDAN